MNFGLELATRRVGGVEFDLAALSGGREPESLTAALRTYAALLLPERDLEATLRQLEPLVTDPELASKVAAKAPEELERSPAGDDLAPFGPPGGSERRPRRERAARNYPSEPPTAQAHVVGLILGSPEFQRR